MPTIQRRNTLAAGAVVQPLTGSQYEYLPFDAVIEAAIISDPITANPVEASMFSGSDVLLENAPIDELPLTTAVRYPDDYTVQDVAAQGERVGITIRNTDTAARVIRTVVRITPL